MSPVTAFPLQSTRQDKERSQLATQLFGELSGPSRAPRSKSQQRSSVGGSGRTPTRLQERQPKKSKEPQVDLLLDLQVRAIIIHV